MAAERSLPRTALDGSHRRNRLRRSWLRTSGAALTIAAAAMRRGLDVAVAATLSLVSAPVAVGCMIARIEEINALRLPTRAPRCSARGPGSQVQEGRARRTGQGGAPRDRGPPLGSALTPRRTRARGLC